MLKNCIGIDKNPLFIKFAQTALGKLCMIAIFTLLIYNVPLYPSTWQEIIFVAIVIISFKPQYRHLCLFVGMLCLIFQGLSNNFQPDWQLFRINYLYLIFDNEVTTHFTLVNIKYTDLILMLVFSETLIFLMHRFRRVSIFNYPITISYLFIFSLMLVAIYYPFIPMHRYLLWSFIIIYSHYFWFIAYTLLEIKLGEKRDYILDYARYLPIWGFTALPYGKGSRYLRRTESITSEDFAITQLKAIKLAFWALILNFLLNGMTAAQHYFQIPTLSMTLAEYAQGQHYTTHRAWLVLLNRFFSQMLSLTVTGHLTIATCRMLGFRVFRNTYKPLQSKTIAEFWNRYNFYFKELLAEFFFYPTYFRFFKNKPRLRIFFATLSAATFGNIIFHFLILSPVIIAYGLAQTFKGFLPFICYAILLGIAIAGSQMRGLSSPASTNRLMQNVISPILVLVFYLILSLFNKSYQPESILINLKILGSLFNMTW